MNRKQRRAEKKRGGPAPQCASADLRGLFAFAVQQHLAGHLNDAERLYQQILQLDPRHAEALHALGLLANQSGRHDAAADLILKAIARNDRAPAFHNDLGKTRVAQGKLVEATVSYRRALARKPDYVEALLNLAAALQMQGELVEAVASFRQALTLQPDCVDAHYDLGVALQAQGKLEEAEAVYRRALALEPGHAMAHNNLGNVFQAQGKIDEAMASYARSLAHKPDNADAHNNLGVALEARGKLEEAVASYTRALACKSDGAVAHNNLGNALLAQGKANEAAAAFIRALASKPEFAEAQGNLGGALVAQGRQEEALAAYQRALALKPGFAQAHSNVLMAQHYMADVSNADLLRAALGFGQTFDKASTKILQPSNPDPERRLRIGYVSADFRYHPVGYFLARVLSSHDRNSVEAFCYTNSVFVDAMTDRLHQSSDRWRSIAGMSDVDAASLIKSDGVDILIDLSGHTAKNRLPLFALRPAPVQASWLGYFGTTGLAAMDYVLADVASVPPGEERWYSEAIVRLPYGQFCYEPPEGAPQPVAPPSLRRGHLTFGSFNNVAKISSETVRLWAEILQATAGARLVLKWKTFGEEGSRQRLIDAFAKAGIAADRLELRGFSPHKDMLAEYGDIDIALDPFPFSGGLTSCEALLMGVPVVTLPGDRPISRQTLGFLQQLGMDDLASATAADYVVRATALAADPHRLTLLRHSLRSRLASSPMCNGPMFTAALESAFREIWRRFCSGQPAATFDAPPLAEGSATNGSPKPFHA